MVESKLEHMEKGLLFPHCWEPGFEESVLEGFIHISCSDSPSTPKWPDVLSTPSSSSLSS